MIKGQGREVDHPHSSEAEGKNEWSQWRLVGLSNGRAGARIIIWLMKRPNRALHPARTATQPLMFSVYSRVKLWQISLFSA